MRQRANDGSCSRCRGPRDRSPQRYCRSCHAANMRARRPKHSQLHEEARQKANARAYANEYQKRGHLVPAPCEVCADQKAEKHHDDYTKPLAVRWLCRPCHLAVHKGTEHKHTLA